MDQGEYVSMATGGLYAGQLGSNYWREVGRRRKRGKYVPVSVNKICSFLVKDGVHKTTWDMSDDRV